MVRLKKIILAYARFFYDKVLILFPLSMVVLLVIITLDIMGVIESQKRNNHVY